MPRPTLHSRLVLACLLGLASAARAAGGHHAVEDAALLDPGVCQLEVWVDRAAGGRGTILHAGPGCRAGPVELSLNLDRFHAERAGTATVVVPQLKWAVELVPSLSTGIVVAAAVHDHSPAFLGSSVVVPLTWEAAPGLLAHLNVGRDFVHRGPNAARGGVAVEWQAAPCCSLVAERFREARLDFWRAGFRYALRADLGIDVSRAEGMAGAPSRWALGLNFVFDR
jgi:hypothetical protein